MADYMTMLNKIYKPIDSEGEAAIKESLDRHRKYKLAYNKLLGQYKALLDPETIDSNIDKVKEIMGRLDKGLKLIGKAHENEVEEGFLLTEMKGYVISLDDGAYQDKIKEIAGDMWELKILDLHKKSKRLVAIFGRPYYWKHANVIDE